MRINENLISQELIKVLDSIEFDNVGGLLIESINYYSSNIEIIYSIYNGESNSYNQLWKLTVKDFKAQKINLDWADSIEGYSDHFLLWEFNDTHTELYFKMKARNPDKLLADIYKTHKATFGEWLDIEKYIPNLISVSVENSGLFAKGPKKILNYYFKCLENNGNKPYFFGEHKPKQTGKDGLKIEDSDCKILIVGQSYFIGREFLWKQS